MWIGHIRLSVVAAAMCISLVSVGSAVAATRVASPTGSGSTCDAAAPCDLPTAFTAAGDGDELILEPGTYGSLATPIMTDIIEGDDIDLHGTTGQPRPVIISGAVIPLAVEGPASKLRHLEVQGLDPGNIGAIRFGGVLAEDFVSVGGGVGGRGCDFKRSPLVRNAVCYGTGLGVDLDGTVAAGINPTFRNVTITGGEVGLTVESSLDRPTSANAINTIVTGGVQDVALHAFQADATLSVTHSNFSTPVEVSESPPGSAVLNDDGTNQTAAPLLGDPAASPFHQLAGSPTIDAGIASGSNGTTDIDGQGRTQGAAPDIGADEMEAPLALALSAKQSQKAKRLKAKVTCSSGCEVHLTGKGKADGRRFSTRAFDQAIGPVVSQSARVRFKKKTLKRIDDERGRLTLKAIAVDSSGHTASDSVNVKLRPAR